MYRKNIVEIGRTFRAAILGNFFPSKFLVWFSYIQWQVTWYMFNFKSFWEKKSFINTRYKREPNRKQQWLTNVGREGIRRDVHFHVIYVYYIVMAKDTIYKIRNHACLIILYNHPTYLLQNQSLGVATSNFYKLIWPIIITNFLKTKWIPNIGNRHIMLV